MASTSSTKPSASNPTNATSSIAVAVHPLVIMNVSEHWTRMRAQNNGQSIEVFGMLIGKQEGRNVEICNSFEVKWDIIEHKTIIDDQFFRTREAQYKEVFPDLDFIGWYTTGDEKPNADDLHVHMQICQWNESPILLKLDPAVNSPDKVPLHVFESMLDTGITTTAGNSEAIVQLVPLQWSLASEEAERIGVEHVARITDGANSVESAVSKQLSAQLGAVKMLRGRLELIVAYLQAVDSGQLPRNEEIFRRAGALCHRLPMQCSQRFKNDYENQRSDIKLTAYLGAMSTLCGTMNELVNKLNVVADRHGGGGGGPGSSGSGLRRHMAARVPLFF